MKAFAALFLLSASVFAQPISLRPIATGLTDPLAITNAKDSRLFITQQTGQILIYDGTQVLPTPFLDIHALVSCCGERGLLSVAFHPQYAQNGYFYVYYTNTGGDITIVRYHVSSNPNVADPSSAFPLLTIPHPGQANHNGGQLQFGPDGFLYAGTGDGGGGGDPSGNGQNLGVLLGKILRIDVDNGSPYGIPPLNPFVGTSGARGEIWAYGVRNPWRFSFDRETGDLFIGDVGQNLYEEVDFQLAMSTGGQNYGWNIMEGLHCYNAATCNQSGLTLPIIEYGHTNGACSITGGYRYRGIRSSRLRGVYFYADYCNGVITGATEDPDLTWTTSQLYDAPFQITAFGEDVSGELYLTDYSGGRVLAIDDPLSPTISSISPASGVSNGGDSVTITGTNLSGTTSVTFGGAAAAITANTSTSVTVTTPPAPSLGTVSVLVTTSAGTATTSFRYDLGAPVVVNAIATNEQSISISWSAVPGASGYEVTRTADRSTFTTVTTTSNTQASDTVSAQPTAYLYRVRPYSGPSFGAYAIDLATNVIFDDDPLVAGTVIKASHFTQLRTAVNAVHILAGLGTYGFTDSLTPGSTPIRAVHLTELRSALDDARNRIGVPALSYGEPSIVAGSTTVKASHLTELRDGVK